MRTNRARIWVTRPREQASQTATLLQVHAVEAVIYPLLRYSLLPASAIDFDAGTFDTGDVLAFTSSYAVSAFVGYYDVAQVSNNAVFCVGDSTRACACQSGFRHVYSADGDVEALSHMIAKTCTRGRRVLHFAACHTIGDLQTSLQKQGFIAKKIALYDTIACEELSDEIRQALSQGKIDGVLFYSPKTARVFQRLVYQSNLQDGLKNSTAFCLSRNIENELQVLDWQAINTAEQPNEASLMRRIAKRFPRRHETP